MNPRDLQGNLQGFIRSDDPSTYPTRDIRSLEAQGGNQNAILEQGGDQANQFSEMIKLLRQYQNFGQQQQTGAERAQAQSVFQTPQNLIGANPSLQAGVRSDVARSFEPTIGGAKDLVSQAKEAITNYQTAQNTARDDARAVIKDALTIGGGASLDSLAPEELTSLEKAAGYPKGYLQGLTKTVKEREIELKKLGGGLTTSQINQTVSQIAQAFDNEPIVKNFNLIAEGFNFAKEISNETTNPSDDQALIYAFAKAMDPTSVVREGEYATVQKYAQSWIKAYGKSVTQAVNGTGFLSKEARANIKKTIQNRYNVSKTNYDNVFKEYNSRIDKAKLGQMNSLTDYSKAYPSTSGPKEGDTKLYNGITYKKIGNNWVKQ